MKNNITSDNLILNISVESGSKPINTYILNASGADLEQILNNCFYRLDEYMQLAGEAGDEDVAWSFNDDYKLIEKLYRKSKVEELTFNDRNLIRYTMKQANKQAGLYVC